MISSTLEGRTSQKVNIAQSNSSNSLTQINSQLFRSIQSHPTNGLPNPNGSEEVSKVSNNVQESIEHHSLLSHPNEKDNSSPLNKSSRPSTANCRQFRVRRSVSAEIGSHFKTADNNLSTLGSQIPINEMPIQPFTLPKYPSQLSSITDLYAFIDEHLDNEFEEYIFSQFLRLEPRQKYYQHHPEVDDSWDEEEYCNLIGERETITVLDILGEMETPEDCFRATSMLKCFTDTCNAFRAKKLEQDKQLETQNNNIQH